MSSKPHESECLLPTTRDESPRPSHSDDDTLADEVHGSIGLEQTERDRKFLDEEQETEELLTTGKRSNRLQQLLKPGKTDQAQKKSKRKSRRSKRRGTDDEVSELMYEMEEGGEPSNSDDSSRGSSESDENRLRVMQGQKAARRKRIRRRVIIHGSIFVLFVLLLLASYGATRSSQPNINLIYSNGTTRFAATTILISLDGFRADFLNRGLTPTLNYFIQEGVSPKYMLPSFPSLTFPNHYTLVTGLYPESHGIVGNTFWDPNFDEEFYYTHPAHSMQPKWWGGEPLWETAEKNGVKTAIHMWPGSEAHIGAFEPSHLDKYNGSEVLSLKVQRILGLLDLPGPDMPAAKLDNPRPQFITAYVPNVDADGHKYGPNSTEIRSTIQDVDSMLTDIFHGLEQRNLTKIVNVIVVSDHGMATTSVERLVQLDDLVDPDLLSHIDGWPLYGLRPKNIGDLDSMHQQILERTRDIPNVDVYLRDKDMPERYHFSNNDRIAPLWLVPKTGWAIVKKAEFDVHKALQEGLTYNPRGLHGYDHEHPLMRAIFVARGPAFHHEPGSRVEPFQNTEIYNIVCDSLGIEPRPNNGTLRLPLKPVGLHTDPDSPPNETPNDPPAEDEHSKAETSSSSLLSMTAASPTLSPIVLSQSSSATLVVETPSAHTSVAEPPSIPEEGNPQEENPQHGNPQEGNSQDGNSQEGNPNEEQGFWDWFHHKWDEAKDWVTGTIDKLGGSKEPPPPAGT